MGLSSVMSTAVSGLQAAETTIDVAGNNVANSNTVGFKASSVVFATQFLQTLGLGSAPSDNNGGTNPRQVGLGTQVAAITPNFTQGTLEISSTPSDLAIQGDGFFIVRSTTGEKLYTRNGKFRLNSANELTTLGGERVLGFGVDSDFQIQSTDLTSLKIPLGAAAVARATKNVFMQGTLTPTGNVADQGQIIESAIFGDASKTAPSATAQIAAAFTPTVGAVTTGSSAVVGNSLTPNSTYQYKVAFVDVNNLDTESLASASISATTGAGQNTITLNNLPTGGSAYSRIRIYRQNGANYDLIAEQATSVGSFTDTGNVAPSGTLGAQTALTGNYSYYVTFAGAVGGPPNGLESRPSQLVGPISSSNGRIQLSNLPTSSDPDWQVRRIYRNSVSNPNEFRYLGELTDMTATSFTDGTTDAAIASNTLVDLNGPRANGGTKLLSLLKRGDTSSTNVFQAGTLQFTGKKGGRTLATKSLTIDSTTDVNGLIQFLRDSSGIQSGGSIPTDITGLTAGGAVTGSGTIRMVSNNGVDNAVSVDTTSLTLITSSGNSQVLMDFTKTQDAVGNSAVADFLVYDSLGAPKNVRITTVLEQKTNDDFTYRWFADSPANEVSGSQTISVGTGLIKFDSSGKVLNVSNTKVSIQQTANPSLSLDFDVDFAALSGLASATPSLAASRQDGFPPGKLTSYIIGEDGIINGVFDNGTQRNLGKIRLARFANPTGLEQRGKNLFAPGVNSGLEVPGNPSEEGIGTIVAGAVELSNTDVSQALIQLVSASTQYRANARVITSAQQLLDELLNIRR